MTRPARRPRALRLALVASATALALAVGAPLAAVAIPGVRTDYPSWQDVQNAKNNEAAKQAEIQKLNAALQQSQQKAAQLEQDEALKEEAYNTAQAALEDATKKADALEQERQAAQATADASARRAAGLIADMDRSGDPTLGLLSGSGHQADQLLQELGSMNRLSTTTQQILERAQFDKNTAAAVAKQAKVAETTRQDLADKAKAAYAAAEQAATAAETEVAQEEAAQQTMYAQLAALKNTTAQVEQQYQAGVNAANAAAGIPPLPAGAIGTVIAFAEAQLGKPYVLGGAGPKVWDCSGLTMVAWAQVGVNIGGHGSTMQYNFMKRIGHLVNIPRNSTQGMIPGDLIFYSVNGSASDAVKTHVAMYIGGGQMIEAPNPLRTVRIVPVRYSDYESRLVPQVGRIVMG
jgi:cell wall-associated NlpC family hydrolase